MEIFNCFVSRFHCFTSLWPVVLDASNQITRSHRLTQLCIGDLNKYNEINYKIQNPDHGKLINKNRKAVLKRTAFLKTITILITSNMKTQPKCNNSVSIIRFILCCRCKETIPIHIITKCIIYLIIQHQLGVFSTKKFLKMYTYT